MDHLHHGHGVDMRRPGHEAALRAVQKPPAKPWRGGAAAAAGAGAGPAPPKVYRVEPREFRELVQRLTGAPAARQSQQHHQVMPTQPLAVRPGGLEEAQMYAAAAPWCSFPMMNPASMAGLDAHHGNLI